MPPAAEFEARPGHVLFFNLKGDPNSGREAKQRYSVVPAYVEAVDPLTNKFSIRWYCRRGGNRAERGRGDRHAL